VLDELPTEIKAMFLNAIRTFPNVQFLWKWDKGQQRPLKKDIPENLFLGNWFNQQDVLGEEPVGIRGLNASLMELNIKLSIKGTLKFLDS